MHITIEDGDLIRGNVKLQALIGFLVHIYDPASGEEPANPSVPAVATAAAAGATAVVNATPTSAPGVSVTFVPPPPPPETNNGGDDESDVPPPPPPNNVVTLPVPPPPANVGNVPPPPAAANTAATSTPAPAAGTAGAASGVVSAEVDSAGMPYDARIHQKAKGKKKNGEWKLIKGVDENLVKTVTAELAARRGLLPQPPAAQGGNTLPLLPQSHVGTTATGVPVPPVSATVPVPPAPAVGSAGNTSAYRTLIDRITALTREGKITPQKVAEICQANGAPSLMALNHMPDLVPAVAQGIDAAALGLM